MKRPCSGIERTSMTLAERLADLEPAPFKILTVDIETSPHLAWTFSTWNTNISPDMIVEPSRVLCFAAKWLHERRVIFHGEWQDTHEAMVRHAHELLDEADIVVTYNGPGFDEKHLAREFLLAGLQPPSPYQSIDLLKTARGRFKFPSNRLGQVGEALNIGSKLDTGGWSLWEGVLAGDPKARAKFARYNKQDVILTEQLLLVLRNWIKGLPHAGLGLGDMSVCYACGAPDLAPVGVTRSKSNAWLRLRCGCGAWNKMLANGETRPA